MQGRENNGSRAVVENFIRSVKSITLVRREVDIKLGATIPAASKDLPTPTQHIRLYIVDSAKFAQWKSKLQYFSRHDPKGYEGVQYISAASAGLTYPSDVLAADVDNSMSPREILTGLLCEEITYPTLSEIELECEAKASVSDHRHDFLRELVALVAAKAKHSPSTALISTRSPSLTQDISLRTSGIGDGEVLLIKRNTVAQLVSECQREIWRKHTSYSMMMLRNADDFTAKTGQLATLKGKTNAAASIWSGHIASRAQFALLYTDEDTHVASYVRTHFDALDRASGADIDVLFIESPSQMHAEGYWRAKLDELVYVVWRSLGWDRTKPYNKADAYDIAKAIGVPISKMPCAILVVGGRAAKGQLWPLKGDLTEAFRSIFAQAHHALGHNLNLESTSTNDAGRNLSGHSNGETSLLAPLCFLSHSSKDKETVRSVATTLHTFGIETWFDEWEIALGDSIPGKIQDGLTRASHVIIFLSKASTESRWVMEELNSAVYRAVSTEAVKVIPVLLEECHVPAIIASKARLAEHDPHKIAYALQKAISGSSLKLNITVAK